MPFLGHANSRSQSGAQCKIKKEKKKKKDDPHQNVETIKNVLYYLDFLCFCRER